MDFCKDKIEQIVERYGGRKEALIMIMQDIQDEYNYLPKGVLTMLSKRLDVPLNQIYNIATYYRIFSLKPRGRHIINVCLGTACHVKGGVRILEKIERELNISSGDTTPDLRFTLETVRCVGACSLAPIVIIDEHPYGRMCQDKVTKLLKRYK